jgi:hypothetical protein
MTTITKANRAATIARLNREGHNLPLSMTTRELREYLEGGADAVELVAADPEEALLSAFDMLDASGRGYYVALSDLRRALPGLSRAEFDRTIQKLRRDWVLTLDPAEGRHETVPRDVLDAGIMEQGRLLVYVARRE